MAKKRIEFITAVINDIEEEDIQSDYRNSFDQVILAYISLSQEYDSTGFNEHSEALLSSYNQLLIEFERDYEI